MAYNSKAILVLIESLDLDDSSGTKGRVALLNNMVAAGFAVTALHYTQKEVQLEGVSTVSINEPKALFYFLSRLQRYFYKWFGINIGNGYEKRTGFSFNWKGAERAFAKALKKHDPKDFKTVWTLGKGTQFRAHHALLSCPDWHSKWYAYVHDPYPQQLYPRPYNFVPLGYKQKRHFFTEVTKKSKIIVFPSLLLKEWMQSYFVEIANKSLIIPHQISKVKIEGNVLPSYFDSEKFTILHGGNLLDLRNPVPVINAYKKFLKACPEAKTDSALLFLGKPGAFKEILKREQKNLPQLYASSDYVPFEQVYQMQQKTTVNIILEAQSEISPFLPGKFAHCVAANKPIFLIGPYYSECKRLLGNDYPYSFEFKEIDKIAQAMAEVYTAWREKKTRCLDRPDLEQYLSATYLKKVLT